MPLQDQKKMKSRTILVSGKLRHDHRSNEAYVEVAATFYAFI